MNTPEQSQLGKSSSYADQYDATLLFPIARRPKREEIGLPATLPFFGADLWTAYELSWLNPSGKPQVAIARLDRKSTRLNSSHMSESRMPSSA